MSVDPKQIRTTLHKLADILADEAESNSDFAEKLAKLIGTSPKKITNTAKKNSKSILEPIPFDVFHVYLKRGIDGLIDELKSLNIQQLREIIRKNRFDPVRTSSKWKEENQDRFIALISDAVDKRMKQGETFRNYSSSQNKILSKDSNPTDL
jgi:hypothetical protein